MYLMYQFYYCFVFNTFCIFFYTLVTPFSGYYPLPKKIPRGTPFCNFLFCYWDVAKVSSIISICGFLSYIIFPIISRHHFLLECFLLYLPMYSLSLSHFLPFFSVSIFFSILVHLWVRTV